MKNRSIGSEHETKPSSPKRRKRKMTSTQKRGNRSQKQILDRVSIFDDLDNLLTSESISTHEEKHITLDFVDSADGSEPLSTKAENNDTDKENNATTVIFPSDKETVGKDTEKIQRRRQIDPTTCERDYSDAEIEFMNALDTYKRTSGRMFPTCSEILEVLLSLGYRKSDQPEAVIPEPEKTPEQQTPSTPAFLSSDEYREPLAIF